MTISLGGSTFPSPVKAPDKVKWIGERTESQNGTLLSSYSNVKLIFPLKWPGLSATDKANLWTKAQVTASQTYTDVSGTSFTVVALTETWNADPWTKSDGTLAYEVSLELEEAS